MMNEAQFTIKFGNWFMVNKHLFLKSVGFEYKVARGNTFNLKSWIEKQPHQLRSLRDAQSDAGVYHKISDQSSGQKPLDAFFLKDAESFLVIYFNNQKKFFILPYSYLVRKLNQTSVSYKELEEDLIAHELLKTKQRSILQF